MKCLIQFYAEWLDFRYPEFDALLRIYGLDPNDVYSPSVKSNGVQHFLIGNFPDDQIAQSICSRSVLIKSIHELWGEGDCLSSVIASTKQLPSDFLSSYFVPENSWSVQVDSFCKTFSMTQKQECRLNFRFLDFQGPVDISNAKVELWLIMDYSDQPMMKEKVAKPDQDVVPSYFGRLVARGGMRNEKQKYDLKKRLYLGPTSLDDSLALILSNICGVIPGSIAYDPFVGTASILVALSHFGAYCMGSDIDPRVLRGEMYAGKADRKTDTTKRDIFENFKAYGFQRPDLIRMDTHSFDRHCNFNGVETATTTNKLSDGFFDVIITDPPYGIRAGGRKSGKSKALEYTVEEERRHDHIPSTQQYAVEEVMLDLLHTAARCLVIGGMLSYLIPTTYDFTVNDLPTHPCLEMVQICHQSLSTRHGRRAVFMRKYRNYTSNLETEYEGYKQHIMSGQDTGFGALMSKLRAALAADAFENEAVVKITSNCAAKRKISKENRKKQRQEGIVFPRNSEVSTVSSVAAVEDQKAEV